MLTERSSVVENPELLQQLAFIEQAGKRLGALIGDLLSYSLVAQVPLRQEGDNEYTDRSRLDERR